MGIRQRKTGRDKVAIIAEILEMAVDGELKSNIMWKAGLNYFMLNNYLELMMKAELLDRVSLNEKTVFKATSRGMEYLHHCYSIKELLGENGDNTQRYYRFAHVEAV